LVIGSGLAGLYSAINASKKGKVAVVTKSTLKQSSTYRAQGGIAAAIGKNDSPKFHFNDTIKSGKGLSIPEAVEILINEGVERINELIKMGMKFDRENGEIALGLEGAHSHRRVLHAGGDATGNHLMNFLAEKIKEIKNISVFEHTIVHELICEKGECFGAYALNFTEGKDKVFTAKSTIIASGGVSGIYQRTTNPHTSTGDGVSLAYNAGAEIADMEFIQFHPTAFYSESGRTFLISEAVRGEGAYLVNHKNERFMIEKHEKAELAPRDVVSASIYEEMKKSYTTNVFLKLDHLDSKKIKKRFFNIYTEAKKYGIDITKDPVPVAPAAHYMIGGIKTGLNAETNIKRLYACGEVASTGVHGANRLASNSLLECIVFGYRAAQSSKKEKELNSSGEKKYSKKKLLIDNSKEEIFVELRNLISNLMTENLGIVRSEETINSCKKEIEKLRETFEFDENEYFGKRLKSLLDIGSIICSSALIRKETRGAHIRSDFPEENDEFIIKIIHTINEKTKLVKLLYWN
jgi:L-aspartate oxidase